MTQIYKPSRKEFIRLSHLPFILVSGRQVHYDDKNYYQLDGCDLTVECWDREQVVRGSSVERGAVSRL